MDISVGLMRKLEKVEPQLREVLYAILEEIEAQRKERVTRDEFRELKEIVKELAEAQKRTEERVNELAEAQKRTEERLTRLEETVEKLAEAQKRTEEELQKLIGEHRKTREQLGGLSITVGYVLENEALKALPRILKKEFGIELKERLVRKFIRDREGKDIEINIIGRGKRNGKEVIIIGEGKVQLSKNKVREFVRKKLRRVEGVFREELFPILVTHMISEPDVEEFAKSQGIKKIFYSYEF